jgi:hypothetical protein
MVHSKPHFGADFARCHKPYIDVRQAGTPRVGNVTFGRCGTRPLALILLLPDDLNQLYWLPLPS